MTLKFGDLVIVVETDRVMDGKRPGLYVGNTFCIQRVGRFTNKDCAEEFLNQIIRIMANYGVRKEEPDDDER